MRKYIIFAALAVAISMGSAFACGKQGCPDYNQTPSVGVGVAVGVGVGVNATNTNTNTNTVSPNIAVNPNINPTISPVISPTNTNTVAPVINNNPTNTQTSSQDNAQTNSQTNSQTNGQANSQSTTFTSPDNVTIKNVPAVMSGNVYPTSPCMGSSQAGGSGVGLVYLWAQVGRTTSAAFARLREASPLCT